MEVIAVNHNSLVKWINKEMQTHNHAQFMLWQRWRIAWFRNYSFLSQQISSFPRSESTILVKYRKYYINKKYTCNMYIYYRNFLKISTRISCISQDIIGISRFSIISILNNESWKMRMINYKISLSNCEILFQPFFMATDQR